jgi:hypothetical protein
MRFLGQLSACICMARPPFESALAPAGHGLIPAGGYGGGAVHAPAPAATALALAQQPPERQQRQPARQPLSGSERPVAADEHSLQPRCAQRRAPAHCLAEVCTDEVKRSGAGAYFLCKAESVTSLPHCGTFSNQ